MKLKITGKKNAQHVKTKKHYFGPLNSSFKGLECEYGNTNIKKISIMIPG